MSLCRGLNGVTLPRVLCGASYMGTTHDKWHMYVNELRTQIGRHFHTFSTNSFCGLEIVVFLSVIVVATLFSANYIKHNNATYMITHLCSTACVLIKFLYEYHFPIICQEQPEK